MAGADAATQDSEAAAARIFLSYSHDSEAHKQRVLELCERLRQDGVNAWLDRYELSPEEGWPRWTRQQVQSAASVLVICSATYKRRAEGAEAPGKGLGATWEALAMEQVLYESAGLNQRFVPVHFEGDEQHVLSLLRPYARFAVPTQYEALLRRLGGQPDVSAPPLGRGASGTLDSAPVARASDVRQLAATPRSPVSVQSGGAPPPEKANPFVGPGPAKRPEDFHGREAILGRLGARIHRTFAGGSAAATDHVAHHGGAAMAAELGGAVQLIGETRMGKTSLLYQVRRLLPNEVRVAWLDAQGQAGYSPAALLRAAAEQLRALELIDVLLNSGTETAPLEALERLTLLFDGRRSRPLGRTGLTLQRRLFQPVSLAVSGGQTVVGFRQSNRFRRRLSTEWPDFALLK